jgi:hypothetical protein
MIVARLLEIYLEGQRGVSARVGKVVEAARIDQAEPGRVQGRHDLYLAIPGQFVRPHRRVGAGHSTHHRIIFRDLEKKESIRRENKEGMERRRAYFLEIFALIAGNSSPPVPHPFCARIAVGKINEQKFLADR